MYIYTCRELRLIKLIAGQESLRVKASRDLWSFWAKIPQLILTWNYSRGLNMKIRRVRAEVVTAIDRVQMAFSPEDCRGQRCQLFHRITIKLMKCNNLFKSRPNPGLQYSKYLQVIRWSAIGDFNARCSEACTSKSLEFETCSVE